MLAAEFFPVWGGTGSYIIELIKSLPKSVDIHVVTLKRNIVGMHFKEYSGDEINSILNREIQIHYVSQAKETFLYNLPFQLACLRKIPNLHREYRFDITHSHLTHMPDVFLKLIGRNSIPTVLTIHGTIQMLREHALLARSMFGGLEASEESILRFYPFIRILEQSYVERVNRLIAVSKATTEFVVTQLGVEREKISLVYNGVDTKLFSFPTKSQIQKKYSKPTVVYIGRLISKKGINVLIDAMPYVLRSCPETRFIFVGGGNISLYKETLVNMGIPPRNFSFVGHVGYFGRASILQEATVFVNPSFFENCSISILEAMSCGCAVTACNVGGNPEIIESGRNGLLVPAFKNKPLSDSIVSLLKDEDYNKSICFKARKTIEEKFSSENFGRETYKIYQQVLKKQ